MAHGLHDIVLDKAPGLAVFLDSVKAQPILDRVNRIECPVPNLAIGYNTGEGQKVRTGRVVLPGADRIFK